MREARPFLPARTSLRRRLGAVLAAAVLTTGALVITATGAGAGPTPSATDGSSTAPPSSPSSPSTGSSDPGTPTSPSSPTSPTTPGTTGSSPSGEPGTTPSEPPGTSPSTPAPGGTADPGAFDPNATSVGGGGNRTVSPHDTTPPTGLPATVSADALPTVQVNGIVWAQVVVGNTVIVTGNFTRARPAGSKPGQNEVVRNNLLAYTLSTGQLRPEMAYNLNAEGLSLAVTPDGSRIFLGGHFTAVAGSARGRIAEFDAHTLKLTSFKGRVDGFVNAVTAWNNQVFVGGAFSAANGVARRNLAAFVPGSGGLTKWNPTANATVQSLTTSADGTRVVVGGKFTVVGGQTRYGLGPVNVSAGVAAPWPANFPVQAYGSGAGFYSLTHDAKYIYATAFNFNGEGNFEGRVGFDLSGRITMLDDCHGDTYSVFAVNNVLYSASHSHSCKNIGAFPETSPRSYHFALADSTYATGTVATNTESGYANFAGYPSPSQLAWYPTFTTGDIAGQSTWSVSGNANYVVFGGEFPTVNGAGQQGLVRFALKNLAPNRYGPFSAVTPNSITHSGGSVRVQWQVTWDRDNGDLIYDIYRKDAAVNAPGTYKLLTSPLVKSRFWDLYNVVYTNTGVPSGAHTYLIRVRDKIGNAIYGGKVQENT